MTKPESICRAPTVAEWEQLADAAFGILQDADFKDDGDWRKWHYTTVLGVEYRFCWKPFRDSDRGQFLIETPTWSFMSRTLEEDTSEKAIGLLHIGNEDIFRTELLALYFWMYGG